jgi:hypothetical protein
MTKLISQQNSLIVKNNIVVGNLPNTNANDILIYNKKQTDRKLKEISNSDKEEMTEITKAIAQWGYALGITVLSQDLVLLNNFVRENFPNINIFDLKVCVKLVSIDSDLLETDAEHYGKLTMIYVSKVLKAYEKYKGTVCFGVREKVLKLEHDNKPPMSKEERLKNFKKLLTDAKNTINNGDFFEDLGEVVYNFVKFNKLMPITKGNIDQNLIDKAMESGEIEFKSYVSDSKRGNLKKIINDVSFTSTKKEEMVRRYARRYVAQLWVEKMNLEPLLKNLTYEMLLY